MELSSPRYWDDDAYAKFYQSSVEEKRLMNCRPQKLSSCKVVRPPRACQDGGWDSKDDLLSVTQLAQFQRAFAETSSGKGFITGHQLNRILHQLGTPPRPGSAGPVFDFKQQVTYKDALGAYKYHVSPSFVQTLLDDVLDDFVLQESEAAEADVVKDPDCKDKFVRQTESPRAARIFASRRMKAPRYPGAALGALGRIGRFALRSDKLSTTSKSLNSTAPL